MSAPALPAPVLMLVTEPSERLERIVREAVAGGVNVVQFRYPAAPAEARRNALEQVRAARGNAVLIENWLVGYEEDSKTDGVHLTGADTRAAHRPVCAPRLSDRLLAGQSVHSLEAARASEARGMDYVVAGTIYDSPSHPETRGGGPAHLARICAGVRIPVIAIGGITPERVGACIDAGAAGVAVLSTIMRASDPESAARSFARALASAWDGRSAGCMAARL